VWVASYDRHHMYAIGWSSIFKSKHLWLAWLVYEWFKFCYLMSPQPVKQVSLCKMEDGVLYLKGARKLSVNSAQMRRLKCQNGSTPRRRYWDFS